MDSSGRSRGAVAFFALCLGVLFLGGLCDRQARAEGPVEYRHALASWYGFHPTLDGQSMAWGGIYDPTRFGIAAAPLYPGTSVPLWGAGTVLSICTPGRDGRCVAALVLDTCPGCGVSLPMPWVDLSPATFYVLAPLRAGLIQVTIRVWPDPIPINQPAGR